MLPSDDLPFIRCNMGAAIYLKLDEPEIARGMLSAISGKAAAKAWDSLNAFAVNKGITPLDDFLSVSADDLANLIGDDVVQQISPEIPAEKWFDANIGVSAIETLLGAIRSDGFEAGAGVLQDLHAYRDVLRFAAQHGKRFHFAFDF